MTKKQICQKYPAFAYYSGFSGLEFHHIEYSIDEFVYCVSGAWIGPRNYSYHKLKIHYTGAGSAFVKLHGYRVPLDECILMEV